MPSPFRRIALTAWPYTEKTDLDLGELVGWLRAKGFDLILDEKVADGAGEAGGLPRDEVAQGADLVIVLGGDGSMLYAAHRIADDGPPLLGVNTGHLGFLADVPWAEIHPALERILIDGDYVIESRMRLRPTVLKNGEEVRFRDVLNDVAITAGPIARMVEFRIQVEGRLLGTFGADGLILATPTGSTAYSLSAGGPLVLPGLKVMIINPICPHTLSNRPVVIPADAPVEVVIFPDIEVENRKMILTLDGEHGCELEPDDLLRVTESPDPIRLVRPSDTDFFQIMRDKLHWETHPRGVTRS
ncbi:MAG: NAD(+)/NADH kinase [bacterium]